MNKIITDKLTSFFENFPVIKYKKGEAIIWPHESPKGVIFLLEGNVGQYAITDDGQKIILNIFKPGAFFPMSHVINESKNKYFFEALSDIKCRIAPPGTVLDFLRDNPDVMLDLLSRVYRGTDGLLKRIAELTAGSAKSRLGLELIISCLRFGHQNDNGSYTLRVKTTELADRTGMARETISRELRELERLTIIKREAKQITIEDIDRLESLLSV